MKKYRLDKHKISKEIVAGALVISLVTGNIVMSITPVYAAENKKEEVVYIMTDATGNVNNVNVVNIFGSGSITDYGNYSAVKMLNSTDSINQNGDVITFSTEKNRVYYQGTMENTEIPWNISVTYTLDGKEMTPDELAGTTGKLKIHINISNNEKCKNNYFDNYALQAALTLDTEKCRNIEADGATIANVGESKQLSYTILPGKGLDATITSDVTDFEMAAITINGVKLNLNIEIDDAELMDKVEEIMDSTKKLNDGATELSSGAAALSDGGNSLNSGMTSLNDGINNLDSGVNTLSDGILTIQDGLNTLNAQSGTLTNGSAQVLEALTTIQTNLSNVSMSAAELKKLTDSSAAIKQGINDLYNGAVNLQASLSYEAYKAAMNKNGLDINKLQSGNLATINNLQEQIKNLQATVNQLKSIPNYESNPEYVANIEALSQQIESLNSMVILLQGNNAAIMGTESYLNAVSDGAASLVSGLSALKTNYEEFDKAIIELADTLSDVMVNMNTLKSGINTLVENYKTLDNGINEYTDGVAAIVAGYSKLVDGVGTLTTGSKDLVNGSATLKSGTSELYSGIKTLYNGTIELNDGTNEFYTKTSDMDTQVEDAIDEMVSSISGGDDETVSFVSDKNTDVEAVQFVIKTDAIEKQEVKAEVKETSKKQSFWRKLVNLFK